MTARVALPPSRVGGLGVAVLGIAAVATLAASGHAAPLLVLVVGSCVVLALLVASDDLLLGAGMALLYANAGAIAVTQHELPAVVALGIPALIAVPLLRDRRAVVIDTRPWPPATPWVLAYLAALTVAAAGAADRSEAVGALLTFVTEGLVVLALVVLVVRTPQRLHRVLWVLLAVGATVGGLAVLQTVTGRYDVDFLGLAQTSQAELDRLAADVWDRFDPPRAGGPIGEKNFFAQTLVVLVPVGWVLGTSERGARRLAAAGCTVALLGGIAVTGSRGAAVVVGVVLLAMLVARDVPSWHGLVAAGLVAVLLAAFPAYRDRLTTLPGVGGTGVDVVMEDTAVMGRASSMLGSWRVFQEHPVTGVGPNNYPVHHRAAATEVGLKVVDGRQPHSLYLGLAAETGMLGLGAFLGVAGATLLGLARARRRLAATNPAGHTALSDVVALQYAIGAYLVSGMFLHLAYERYLWLWIGLAGAATATTLARPSREIPS